MRSVRSACAFFALIGAVSLTLLAQDKPRSLYDGASVLFEQAQLIKPREATNLGLAFTLAPLIVQEVGGTNPPAGPARAYFYNRSVQLNGRELQQMTYGWSNDKAEAVTQGIRITLNTNGSPIICEVLGQSGSVSQIFVSQSLEAAARREFAAALPGRRHAIERSLDEAPTIVVPRILDEPATVMGPIIYLHAETHAVATLICRCMESQAKAVVNQGFYELVPADFSGKVSGATRLEAAFPRWFREDFLTKTNRLPQSLRLPREF